MTIEIRSPELEALTLERMKLGAFRNVEDALIQALIAAPPPAQTGLVREDHRMGADLIAAMQASPYREISIEPARYRLPVRDVAF